MRRQTILPSSSGLPNARSLVTPSRPFEQKRWASAAAQAVETEGEVQEEVWPERILPTVSDKDAQRLKRQRNVGMYVYILDPRNSWVLMIVRHISILERRH